MRDLSRKFARPLGAHPRHAEPVARLGDRLLDLLDDAEQPVDGA
jgi:hypothetical protein